MDPPELIPYCPKHPVTGPLFRCGCDPKAPIECDLPAGPRPGLIFAVDPSLTPGYALGTSHRDVQVRRGDLAHGFRGSLTPATRGLVLGRFQNELTAMSSSYPVPGVTVYELAHHRGRGATALHYAMTGILEAWAARHRIEVIAVHSATLKKHATGDGHADKRFMMTTARAVARPGLAIETDDEADAFWLWDYARVQLTLGGREQTMSASTRRAPKRGKHS